MTEAFTCLSCSSTQAKPVYLDCKDYYLGKPYVANYCRCKGCGLAQQSPIPADVSQFYDAYPIHQKKSFVHDFMRRLIMAPLYYPLKSLRVGATLLDYGCGDGWFLRAAHEAGVSVTGYERDPVHAGQLSQDLGVPVESDMPTLLARKKEAFDVVTMHFVLEHLPDLNRAFEEVRGLLKPGGVFYFVVPHLESLEARVFGKKWHNLDSPRHLSFPDLGTARALAGKHGFEVVRHKALPFPNGFAGSIPVLLTGRFRFAVFLLFLPLGILLSRLVPTGTYGYWLQKKRAHS